MQNVVALKPEIIKSSGSRLRHKTYLSTCLHLVLIILSLYNIKMNYKWEIRTKTYSYFSSGVLSRYSFFAFFCTFWCSLRVIYFKTIMISRGIWPRQDRQLIAVIANWRKLMCLYTKLGFIIFFSPHFVSGIERWREVLSGHSQWGLWKLDDVCPAGPEPRRTDPCGLSALWRSLLHNS